MGEAILGVVYSLSLFNHTESFNIEPNFSGMRHFSLVSSIPIHMNWFHTMNTKRD